MMTLNSFKPGVNKSWLIAVAGLMWTGVGVMLCRIAYNWLAVANRGMAESFGLLGVSMAVAGGSKCRLEIFGTRYVEILNLHSKGRGSEFRLF